MLYCFKSWNCELAGMIMGSAIQKRNLKNWHLMVAMIMGLAILVTETQLKKLCLVFHWICKLKTFFWTWLSRLSFCRNLLRWYSIKNKTVNSIKLKWKLNLCLLALLRNLKKKWWKNYQNKISWLQKKTRRQSAAKIFYDFILKTLRNNFPEPRYLSPRSSCAS